MDRYRGPVFADKVGEMKWALVEQKYEAGVKAVRLAQYQWPYHYQERQNTHLKKLEKEGVIEEAGRPETLEEVRLLLQAADYDIKYSIDQHEELTYEEVTAPLRQLREKNATYRFDRVYSAAGV